MNGRIYDPGLGRFLQADPLIQDLSNPQSLNRYSYVFNNPLAYTDPTGYSAFSKYLRPILAIGAAYFTGGWASSLYAAGNTAGALAVSVGGGALVGAIATGSGKGALIGAFTGAAAFGVGSSIAGGGSNGISNAMALAGAQSLAGGLQGQVNHGNFGAGFAASLSFEWESWRERAIASNLSDAQLLAATSDSEPDVARPGLLESAIPVWGSIQLARADFADGRLGWGAFNSAMAVTDVFLVKSLVLGAGKVVAGTAWKSGSHSWRSTRRWLGKTGQAAKGQPVHHWAAHQGQGFLQWVPNSIKNQPWNLMRMPNQAFHISVHGQGKNGFNGLGRFYFGTPQWFKTSTYYGSGRVANGISGD